MPVAPDFKSLPVVCVQGLGFVGSAMAVAVADRVDAHGVPHFNVVGVDLPTPAGQAKVEAINGGRLPVESADAELSAAFDRAHARGNLSATTDVTAFSRASVAVVDIHLDVAQGSGAPTVDFSGLRAAIRTLGKHLPPGALVLVETTVPPGTCDKVVWPELTAAAKARGLAEDAFLLAHSYERVMPGKDYYRSITNFWRVYAGHSPAAAAAAEAFLSKVINVASFPLTRLSSTTASETAKVLENSYRAVTIAMMDEWTRFADRVGIDLFSVIEAIRVRPTHSNIRYPGFGVGGYCLTKDPLLVGVAARDLFALDALEFPISTRAVAVNAAMPQVAVARATSMLGSLSGKRLLLLGVSYREDVGDTRYSPAEPFVRAVTAAGGTVVAHDPYVRHWDELGWELPRELPSPQGFDLIVLGQRHDMYRRLDWAAWAGTQRPAVLDVNDVLSAAQRASLQAAGFRVSSLGRGF